MSTIKKQKGDHINGNCSPENVLKIRHCIRKQLIENDLKENHISCWTNQQKNVLDLVRRTALLAESNSVLIIGPRGCGKTTLLTNILKELNESDKENMMTVYMNGFLQTDDRIALKEITRQLRLENVVEDKVFGSFAENLTFLLDALKSGGSDTKSILFVLDEFDLFCHHKNQTLLYNLFDIAQSAQTPIAVVGLTCRLDVIELFEKRVKSRFSHRQIYLLNQSTFHDYKHMFINLLSVSADTCSQNIVNSWNKHIKTLSEDKTILSLLQKMFDMDKSIRKLKKFLIMPVTKLRSDQPLLEINHFITSFKSTNHNSKTSILQGLSVLEIALIIAMKRLTVVYDGEPSNFQMLHHEYQKLSQKSSMQNFEKSVVNKAFERLQALELIIPVDGLNSKIQKEYQLMNLAVDPLEIDETLRNNYIGLPTELRHWSSTNI